jgi:hypothetical protein
MKKLMATVLALLVCVDLTGRGRRLPNLPTRPSLAFSESALASPVVRMVHPMLSPALLAATNVVLIDLRSSAISKMGAARLIFEIGMAFVLCGVGYVLYTFCRDHFRGALWYKAAGPNKENKSSHYYCGYTVFWLGAFLMGSQLDVIYYLLNKPLGAQPAYSLRDGTPDMEVVFFLAQLFLITGFGSLATGLMITISALKARWLSLKKALLIGGLAIVIGFALIVFTMGLFEMKNPFDLFRIFHIETYSTMLGSNPNIVAPIRIHAAT